MSIQRVPSVPFAQIANSALRDRRLSFKARGLLALVLSNVGEWNATLAWLVAQSEHDGKASIQAALNELTDLGYRVVTKQSRGRDELQTIVTWHHVPEDAIIRPPKESTVENIDGRETGWSLEEHSLEHHSSEEQVQTLVSATPPREDVQTLCDLLADKIEDNGSPRPTITKGWRDAARLMLDKDQIEPGHVAGAIVWSQNNEFWRSNILSMPKLREKYQQLRLQAERESKPDKTQGWIDLFEEMADNSPQGYPQLEG